MTEKKESRKHSTENKIRKQNGLEDTLNASKRKSKLKFYLKT